MKITLQYAERQLRHWSKKVEELRLTSNASNTKENEGEKRTSPLEPPIEKNPKQEKFPSARACEAFCEAFWERYPKGHRYARRKCFEKLRSRYMAKKDGAEAFAAAVLAGLDKWRACERWQLGFIVLPETFINQERWEDEPPPPDPPRRGVSQTANVQLGKERLAW